MVTLLPWPMKIRASSSLIGGRPWSASTRLTATLHVAGAVDQGAVEVVDHGVEAAGDEIVGIGVHAVSP